MLGKKSRLAASAAVAGAFALLTACSPVKPGAAAIVGSERITSASLATQVSALNSDLAPYSAQLTGLTQQEVIDVVLGWLVTFQVQDRLAASHGITVGPFQVNEGLSYADAQAQQNAEEQNTQYDAASVLPLSGIPQTLKTDYGQFEYQQLALEKLYNGNTVPSTSAELSAAETALLKASCHIAKSLNIQVNPQYGQLTQNQNPGAYSVIPVGDKLSKLGGKPAPSSTPTPTVGFAC